MSTSQPHVVTVDQPERAAPLMPLGLLTNGLFRHREGPRFRRGLDPTAQALFLPGEQIIAAFDGITRLPRTRALALYVIAFGLVHFIPPWTDTQRTVGLVAIAVGLMLRLGCRLLGSRRTMVALTTFGVVGCRTDWLNRPREILQRGPFEAPEFYEGGGWHGNVVIGPVDVYTDGATEEMLWRTMKPGPLERTAGR